VKRTSGCNYWTSDKREDADPAAKLSDDTINENSAIDVKPFFNFCDIPFSANAKASEKLRFLGHRD
jgi:hypothetical protein